MTPATTPHTPAARTRALTRRTAAIAATAAAAAAAAMITCGGAAMAATTTAAHATATATASTAAGTPLNCAAAPSTCGYPDATNTGVPAGTALKSVPAQVSSGPGWKYDPRGWVEVTGKGASLANLSITANVDIQAPDVTVSNVRIVTSGPFGISLRHTAGVTIENSTISGQDTGAGRVGAAIGDVYGDSTAMTFKNNNISDFRIGIQAPTGLVTGNYIHDPGYIAGDHTNGITATGSTEPMTIAGNTVLNSLGQTDAITLDASAPGQPVANKTVTGNLLAGGGYSLYGGDGNNDPTSNITIQDNRFSQQYYPKAGQFGPAAYYDPTAPGNTWTGNIWDTTGQPVNP